MNQKQFRNENAQNWRGNAVAARDNFNQQNRAATSTSSRTVAANQQQNRAGMNQNQAAPTISIKTSGSHSAATVSKATRGAGNSAFGDYSQGGNARTNSARGQQSLAGNRGGGDGAPVAAAMAARWWRRVVAAEGAAARR